MFPRNAYACRSLVVWLLLFGAGSAVAQEVLGGIAGSVTDAAGARVSGARVSLAGTAFGAVTDQQGRYGVERIPAGDYTVRVEIGQTIAAEQSGVHVPAGGSLRLDLVLGGGGAVPAHAVPTAELTSRTRITGDELRSLPVDDPEQALLLAPGVVLRDGDIGIAAAPALSVRGSAHTETAFYIDGAPARLETFGGQGLVLGANAISEVAVTTGVPAGLAADGGGGVISYITRTGGQRLQASLRAESDGPFGDAAGVGYNRFEGAAGGPLAAVRNLTWFVAGSVQGQGSQYRGSGAADEPSYVLGGLDTVVQVTDFSGSVTSVPIPRFVQASGTCGTTGGSGSPLAAAIQGNYGFACTGLRRPFDWSTLFRGQAKVLYSWGTGSSVSLTALASGFEQRSFPGQNIGDPALYQGTHLWSRLVIANWSQDLSRFARGPLALSVNLSLGTDKQISAPLAPASETATRDPALGIELGTLQFTGADLLPFPLTDDIIRNIRTNSGLRVPYLNRTDLRNAQQYRFNPFGMLSGWPTSGLDASLATASERRLNGRAVLQWRPGNTHQVTLGIDVERGDVSFYESPLISQFGQSAFVEHPARHGLFGGDRIAVGSAVIDLGARYDRLSPGGEFATTPGFVFSNPGWSIQAATSDTAYANSVARVFAPGRGHDVFSPRLRAVYSFTPRTSVRVGYGQQLNPVPFDMLFGGVNADLVFTSTFSTFGRDVDYVKSAVLEVGARHALGSDLSVDLSLFRKTNLTPYAYRIQAFPDPNHPGSIVNLNVLTTVAQDDATGLAARVDWRRGAAASGSASYSFLHTPGGGGTFLLPAMGATHALYATAALLVPADWKAGTFWGRAAENVGAVATIRATSGLPYTRLLNTGGGEVAPGPYALFGEPIEAVNASRLPWTKTLDLRLTKGFRAGGRHWSVYADFRNLFNFQNTRALYAETGTVTNDLYRTLLLSQEASQLQNEASANNALLPNGSIDLHACSTWTGNVAPVNCVVLQRVEARFGNGDLIYTPTEQQKALYAYFDSFFGAWRFYGPGRTLRAGVEARF